MHNLSIGMDVVNRILVYLKSSLNKSILFSKHVHLDIIGHTDAYFADFKMDTKSTLNLLEVIW